MGMISALAAQVAGTGPQVVEGDAALAYSRFSRAVRQGILLQTQLLAEPEEAKPAKADADDAPKEIFYSWLENDHSKRAARIDHVEQIVERMARGDGEPEETVERLAREAAEQAEKFEVYGDLAYRPMSEVLAEICRDLGLNPDWTVLRTHCWARKEIAKGEEGEEVGWPLKDGPPPPAGWIGPWPPKRRDPGHVTDAFPSKRGPRLPDAEDWMEQSEMGAASPARGGGGPRSGGEGAQPPLSPDHGASSPLDGFP
jgi:hypothetical protein